MRKLAIIALLIVAWMPAFAIDEEAPNEISIFYGYQWGDGEVCDHSNFGLAYERVFPKTGPWGLMLKTGRVGTHFGDADLDIDWLDISATITLEWDRAKVYFPFGLGLTFADGPGDESAEDLSAHVGAGYKFAFTEQLGLRVEGRYRYANEIVAVDEGEKLHLFETTFGIGWSW